MFSPLLSNDVKILFQIAFESETLNWVLLKIDECLWEGEIPLIYVGLSALDTAIVCLWPTLPILTAHKVWLEVSDEELEWYDDMESRWTPLKPRRTFFQWSLLANSLLGVTSGLMFLELLHRPEPIALWKTLPHLTCSLFIHLEKRALFDDRCPMAAGVVNCFSAAAVFTLMTFANHSSYKLLFLPVAVTCVVKAMQHFLASTPTS